MKKFARSAYTYRTKVSPSNQQKNQISRSRRSHSTVAQAPQRQGQLKFHGTINELQRLTWFSDVRGRWRPLPDGVWRFRCRDGAGMNWSSTRGTLWFDGPDPELLRRIVMAAIRARIYRR
jgi:hypothetical protein